jgi:DNA polymerase/3'-5' exonuclease PolX
MQLNEALAIGESLLGRVRCVTDRVEVAGSVRRRKDNVKDIELVAIVSDYDGLYRRLAPAGRFIKPGVPDVVDWPPKHGAKYVRMLLKEGIKLDLFIATKANWGGIYMMRTGSGVGPDGLPFSGFVPMMFSRWKKVSKGGKMSGGQPTLPDGTMIEVPEEEDVFALFKARWVPAEERTSADAIHSLKEKT